MYYLIVFLAVIGLAANFSLTRIYQGKTGTGLRTGVFFNMVLGTVTAVIFFFINGFMNGFTPFPFTPFSLLMAFLMSMVCGIYAMIGFKIMSLGGVAIYTLFLMLGGMTIPYFFGLIFLNDEISVWRVIGLALMAAAIALAGGTEKREKASKPGLFFALCAIVFCLNGGASLVSKIHQLEDNAEKAVSPQAFVMLTAAVRAVIFSCVYAVIRVREGKLPAEKRPETIKIAPSTFLVVVASAAMDGTSYLLQLIGASHLPATVLYPLITGGSVMLTTLSGFAFFHEKLSRRALAGVFLCFVATFFFL